MSDRKVQEIRNILLDMQREKRSRVIHKLAGAVSMFLVFSAVIAAAEQDGIGVEIVCPIGTKIERCRIEPWTDDEKIIIIDWQDIPNARPDQIIIRETSDDPQ